MGEGKTKAAHRDEEVPRFRLLRAMMMTCFGPHATRQGQASSEFKRDGRPAQEAKAKQAL
jgi:hypothetical protein